MQHFQLWQACCWFGPIRSRLDSKQPLRASWIFCYLQVGPAYITSKKYTTGVKASWLLCLGHSFIDEHNTHHHTGISYCIWSRLYCYMWPFFGVPTSTMFALHQADRRGHASQTATNLRRTFGIEDKDEFRIPKRNMLFTWPVSNSEYCHIIICRGKSVSM